MRSPRRWLLLLALHLLACPGASTPSNVGTSAAAGTSSAKPAICPGATPPGTVHTCHSSDQCDGGICVAKVPTGPFCPAYKSPQCINDKSCSQGQVCHPLSGGCVQADCVPACPEGAVAEDRICAADGHWKPRLCSSGYRCPADFTCTPGSLAADEHGCAPDHCTQGFACPVNSRCDAAFPFEHGCKELRCKSDQDCDCGACINQICAPSVGVCWAPPP